MKIKKISYSEAKTTPSGVRFGSNRIFLSMEAEVTEDENLDEAVTLLKEKVGKVIGGSPTNGDTP